jgi:two-component system response regulator MprA
VALTAFSWRWDTLSTMTDTNGGARLLIAEDDRAVRDSLHRALRLEGYDVVVAGDGAAALKELGEHAPDLVILDVMMPYVDGLTVCRTLRSRGDRTPVLMLTAKHEVADRVAGLDAGADDYLVKPFALDELLARIRALLRRSLDMAESDHLEYRDLEVHVKRRRASRAGRQIDLTKTEFDLLELLMVNADVVLERDVIYDRIWGIDFATSSNSLDVYIGYLRRKTEEGGEPRLIHTVRGVGYVLRDR